MSVVVKDVQESEFVDVVVEGSKSRPVVVDFWAEWCGPCRQLSPLLEQMAEQHAGQVDVVKVNVDHAPRLAQQFGVQGIPAVKAFVDGKVAGEFTGLQPAPVVAQFFAGLGPSEADRLVIAAGTESDADRRRSLLEQAMELEVDHPAAALALAADTDDVEAARAVLARARPTPEVQQAIAALSLTATSEEVGNVDDLRRLVAQGDEEARVALGRALAAVGDHEDAIAVLLDGVRTPSTKDEARDALLEVFTVLGNDHPLVKQARPRLAAALF
ncbi:tetratricopeptide repeat protein [Euzebya pacifica]|jgi:putative thioredoxin|uniref:tetratricopeptide repeat protein n=1 Tax=Euzebya pacifica TaxID=1608957 RepID=UPI0030FC7CF4